MGKITKTAADILARQIHSELLKKCKEPKITAKAQKILDKYKDLNEKVSILNATIDRINDLRYDLQEKAENLGYILYNESINGKRSTKLVTKCKVTSAAIYEDIILSNEFEKQTLEAIKESLIKKYS